MRKLVNATSFIILIVVVVLALMEWFAGLVMIPNWSTYLLPHHYPNAHVEALAGPVQGRWVSNGLGFHDIDHPIVKPNNEKRIAVIGDSFMDGPQSKPFAALLREKMRRKNSNFNVMNFSRPGIDTDLYYVLYRELVKEYDPDLVLLALYEGNDFRGMENRSPEDYNTPQKFFDRFPKASLFGSLLPRLSILISDSLNKRMIFRWTETSKFKRWGNAPKWNSIEDVSLGVSKFVEAEPGEIMGFLEQRLQQGEVEELLTWPVRIDLLSYMISVGLKAKMGKRLAIKGKRPELTSKKVREAQVEAVHRFIKMISDDLKSNGKRFGLILIPTSLADIDANDMYKRLGADKDVLFYETRRFQTRLLKSRLKADGVPFIDLAPTFAMAPGSYLKFDTHWSEFGADKAASAVSENISVDGHLYVEEEIDNSSEISIVPSDYAINMKARKIEKEIFLNKYISLIDYDIFSPNDGKGKVSFMFRIVETPKEDWRIFVHGRVDKKDIGQLPEARRRHGFDNWDLAPKVKTSSWPVGRYILLTRHFRVKPGRYLVETGFYSPKGRQGKTANLGWHNLP